VKRSLLGIILALALAIGFTSPAKAATTIESQILNSNTSWGGNGINLIINGLIQIPSGVTLTIAPGTTLDASNGSFLVLGSLTFGDLNGPLTTVISSSLLAENSSPKKIIFDNVDFEGNGGHLVSGNDITMRNCIFNHYQALFGSVNNLVFTNNTLVEVRNFFPFISELTFGTISNNSFYNLQNFQILGPLIPFNTNPPGTCGTSLVFTNNYFENQGTSLTFLIPPAMSCRNVTGNYFASPSSMTINASGADFSSNYWAGISSESELRSVAKVNDSKTIITNPVLQLSPLLSTAPNINSIISKLKATVSQEKLKDDQAAEKAAADKAAADKAAADKAAADKAAADKAAADKAAVILKEQSDATIRKASDFVGPANVFVSQNLRWSQANMAISFPFKALQDALLVLNQLIAAYQANQTLTPDQLQQANNNLSIAQLYLPVTESRITTYITTITCIKGSKSQKVTGYKPTCPAGYKKK
jgi:hypothetical protein